MHNEFAIDNNSGSIYCHRVFQFTLCAPPLDIITRVLLILFFFHFFVTVVAGAIATAAAAAFVATYNADVSFTSSSFYWMCFVNWLHICF